MEKVAVGEGRLEEVVVRQLVDLGGGQPGTILFLTQTNANVQQTLKVCKMIHLVWSKRDATA